MKRKGEAYPHKYKRLVSQDEFDWVQEILGREGKPRPKTHEFAFTGTIRCGECGYMVTAEEKTKLIKGTGETRSYTYYHCTNKKGKNKCSQSSITLPSLKAQIADFLERIHIPKRFVFWVRQGIERIRQTDNETLKVRMGNLEGVHDKAQKSIEVLTDMRIRELITDKEYLDRRKKLETERDEALKWMKKAKGREENWEDSLKNIFVFAHHSKMWFKKGDLISQKKIVEYFVSNWTLKDKKLSAVLLKPFLLIDETMNGIRSESPRLEPSEYAGIESPFIDRAAQIACMWRWAESNRRANDY